jgi:hypothetical protein
MSSNLVMALLVFFGASLFGFGYLCFLRTKLAPTMVLLVAPLAGGAIIWVATELLSATVRISQLSIWITALLFIIPLAIAHKSVRAGYRLVRSDVVGARRDLAIDARALPGSPWWLWVALGVALLATAVTLFLALWGPPNNADSLGYHLPRVMHWLQNGSVNHYATNDLRQLVIPPLGGYFMLWLYALSGSDYLLNMVQWLSAIWSCTLVAVMLRRICRSWTPGAIALVLALTVPMGIAEATTTQSDWVAALWVIVAATLFVERRLGALAFGPFAILLGVSCALVSATKPTGALSMAAIVAIAAVFELVGGATSWPARIRRFVVLCLTAASSFVLGMLPQAIRNWGTFGTVTGDNYGVVADRFDFVTLIGNSLRILINNVGIPTQFSDYINPQLKPFFELIGIPWVDIAAVGYQHLPSISLARNEDYATSPIQLLGGLFAAVAVLFMIRAPKPLRALAATGIGMFLLTALVWKWNQWSNRFLIQVMLVLVVPLAYLLWRLIATKRDRVAVFRVAAKAVVVAAAIYGLFVSMTIQYRPIIDPNGVLGIPRDDRYFIVQGHEHKSEITKAAQLLSAIPAGSTVGIELNGPMEYPLWALLNADRRYRFVHVDAGNESAKYEPESVDATICVGECSSSS